MKKDTSEAAQLKMLFNIMWEVPLKLLSVETDKDEEKTLVNANGETVKEKFTPYIFYSSGQEVLRVLRGKENPNNILLMIGGKPKNWSKKSLEHILQDVLTLQDTIKSFRNEMLDKSQREIYQKHKDDDDATMAFLDQFMPEKDVYSI